MKHPDHQFWRVRVACGKLNWQRAGSRYGTRPAQYVCTPNRMTDEEIAKLDAMLTKADGEVTEEFIELADYCAQRFAKEHEMMKRKYPDSLFPLGCFGDKTNIPPFDWPSRRQAADDYDPDFDPALLEDGTPQVDQEG
ncbi:unnamed protein product [Vitrella brassicaformis CCMP3155]|uniref:Uncharacterized protein n=2 Tax=Vitrella brassicaformis TaxID=1169539 RepID=A0A0G4ESE5_VITBC|nr:unnamed protein product [Vitrella brassicaformis CCMP3155]|eukprot:CEM01550.1 unnamed protein product [Vitrella brassicaformis CCMP3155]